MISRSSLSVTGNDPGILSAFSVDKSSRIAQLNPIGTLRPMSITQICSNHPSRLYHCARCHKQVILCTHCDRGNIYCAKACARIARKRSRCAAALRYQATRLGKFKHALSQKRYRVKLRLQKKVIDQGSPLDLPPVPFPALNNDLPSAANGQFSCALCGRDVGDSLRYGYLNGIRRFTGYVLRTSTALGP